MWVMVLIFLAFLSCHGGAVSNLREETTTTTTGAITRDLNHFNKHHHHRQRHSETWNTCHAKYRRRVPLPNNTKLPALLYTFPGSGNTWFRLLVEYATGYLTGSAYRENDMTDTLPGDKYCSNSSLMVKVHMIHYHINDVLNNRLTTKCREQGFQIRFPSSVTASSAVNANTTTQFVLLVRNPFDAIWSEYLRRHSQSHTGNIHLSDFDLLNWREEAKELTMKFRTMVSFDYAVLLEKMAKFDLLESNVLLLKYEDLLVEDKKYHVLERLLTYLNLPIDPGRLDCAFLLAETPKVHRNSSGGHTGEIRLRKPAAVVGSTNLSPLFVSKQAAYNQHIVCMMWTLFQKEASLYNYTVWNNFDCGNN